MTERFVKETGVAAGIAEIAEPVLESLGFRLVLARILQGQGTIVEIMAERPDGSMTIDDCRTVSLGLSPVFDVHDPLPGTYRLQVSSPGIDRPVVRPSDFDLWAGFEVKIELKELIDGRRRFRGVIEGFEDGEARIEVDLGKEQGVKLIGVPVGLIAEAKLVLTDKLIRESLQRTKREVAALEMDAEPDPDNPGEPVKLDAQSGSKAPAGRRQSGRKAKKTAPRAKSQG